jgi:hypothetical protein
MTSEHPITPPPELLGKWEDEILKRYENVDVQLLNAYQAGADAELNACCAWIESLRGLGGLMTSVKFRCTISDTLRAARRPKPLSLKEQALQALGSEPLAETFLSGDGFLNAGAIERHRIIRRALEALSE